MSDMASPTSFTLAHDAFARSIKVNSSSPHALFLGAGTSVSSNVPSAITCIWEWKREIFLTNNPELGSQFTDISSVAAQQKIQRWLDHEGGYPTLGAAEEYGFYAERCYPIPEDRRRFFQDLAARAQPYIGYRLLCLLAEAGIITSTWTTNFDALVARTVSAMSANITPIEIGLDSASRAMRSPRRGELPCVQLHGDYRYDALKNTPTELQCQDQQLRAALIAHLRDTTLIVSGYSGRDDSVMSALHDAYAQPGVGRLYWCGYGDVPADVVTALLAYARTHRRLAYYVPTSGFDDLMVQLALACLSSNLRDQAHSIYTQAASSVDAPMPPFTVDSGALGGIIKSNALAIECPTEVLQFDADGFDMQGAWQTLRNQIEGTNVVAALQKGKVLALGMLDDIKQAFCDRGIRAIERSPIDDRELSYADGVIVHLLTDALVRSIASARGLQTDGKGMVWEPAPSQELRVCGFPCKVHNAALLFLRRYQGKQYLVIQPTVKGTMRDGTDLPNDAEQELKRLVLTGQYNAKYNDALNGWINRVLPDGNATFEFPHGSGSGVAFYLRKVPALATIAATSTRSRITLPSSVQQHVVFQGAHYPEPSLLFSNHRGDNTVSDTHPLRGILRNRPYDFALTSRGITDDNIRLGIVCPASDASTLSTYLVGLHQHRRPESRAEYLLEYPGFSVAFGTPLDIPEPNSSCWATCPEPDPGMGTYQGAAELRRHITACIRGLCAANSPNVILIYIPDRWRLWESYDADGEHFDLHDFVKAFCVQHGIATQMLREHTLSKPYQCEVRWWLALSIYIKSMRTPWVLDNHDMDTVYMGLGYSHDRVATRGNQIIIGCSHLYNTQGQGLRYKLSKIESPIIHNRNPYMSRDDAHRMGDNMRRLFFESMMRLPRRVVIHKRTPFLREEREGLLEGLDGIEAVDMIEVNVDPALRFVASRPDGGGFKGDGFPVRRGTAVVLERRRALLWVHGTADAVVPGRNYYLGKSRIPAPLIITRHHGTSSLGVLAREILGLSKMDWNSFDLYTKLPATIESSNRIARIGALLDRFGEQAYDYRLFV